MITNTVMNRYNVTTPDHHPVIAIGVLFLPLEKSILDQVS